LAVFLALINLARESGVRSFRREEWRQHIP
jgi:hypothetical protein